MEILNTYMANELNGVGIIITILAVIGIAISIAVDAELSYTKHTIITSLCFILIIVFFLMAFLTINYVFPCFYNKIPHYEIIVDDSYPVAKLLDKYEIIETNGRIIDCIDRKAD